MPPQRGIRPPGTAYASLADNYAAVCAVLWAERDVLESLACTAIVARLVPRSARAAGVPRPASAARTELVERLRAHEVLRAAMVEALAEASAMPAATTLAELAAGAPQPWATILREHRDALRALLKDVTDLAAAHQLSLAEFLA